jgi:SAM-dependent methyltransferase
MRQPYDRAFFLNLRGGSLQSARVVVPLVLNLLKPQRVIDVGCGSGAWLAALRENGVEDVWGVDGEYLDADLLLVPPERVLRRDLTADLRLDFQCDLVISLEVAEHLAASAAARFVASLTALGPVILFSAAIPGQGGYCHINEQWPEYWARLFADQGYVPVDCIRPQIWNDSTVPFWYRQNLLLYVREADRHKYPGLAGTAPPAQLAVVHPDLYLMKCR